MGGRNKLLHSFPPCIEVRGPPICDAALHTSVTAAGTASPLHSFQREHNLIHHSYFSFYGDPNLLYDRAPHECVCVCVFYANFNIAALPCSSLVFDSVINYSVIRMTNFLYLQNWQVYTKMTACLPIFSGSGKAEDQKNSAKATVNKEDRHERH